MNDFNSEDTCGSHHTYNLNVTNIVGTMFIIHTGSFALKWAPKSYIIISQRSYANGQKNSWKMFNITKYKSNIQWDNVSAYKLNLAIKYESFSYLTLYLKYKSFS